MESGGGRINSRTLTPEEEAMKRNTDCLYFLASPLTCKKGTECEYRHSEGARVNPTDCRYWLNGNCLNPKCLYRHPPLDSLFGNMGTTSGMALPPSQTAVSKPISMVQAPVFNLKKQSVPCIYFQNGQCLKGDRCPFMHGPQPTGKPVSQHVAQVSMPLTKQPQTVKKGSWVIKKCNDQNISKISSDERPLSAKPISRAETPLNKVIPHKKSLLTYPLGNKLPGSQPTHASVSYGNSLRRPSRIQVHPLDDRLQNGRKPYESFGDSFPGSNVIVDGSIKANGYLHNEDNIRRALVQAGRNLDPVNDCDYCHSDYEPVPRLEKNLHNGMGEFEQHGKVQKLYDSNTYRALSGTSLDGPLLAERPFLQRHQSSDEVDISDLRHRLLKQRRLDGSRLAAGSDHCGEPYCRDDHQVKDRNRGQHSYRDQPQFPLGGSISTHLQGRISLPRRSSPDFHPSLHSEKEKERASLQLRLSHTRPVSHQGRHNDRVRLRSSEGPHFSSDARNSGVRPIREVESLNFAGPKSLAELKGAKVTDSYEEQSTKSSNGTIPLEQTNIILEKAVGQREPEDSLPFEPSVILTRKRKASPGNAVLSSNAYENQHDGAISSLGVEKHKGDGDAPVGSSVSVEVSEVQSICVVESNKDDIHTVTILDESRGSTAEENEEEEEGLIPSEDEDLAYAETEDMEVDTMEDQELQNSDPRYGESAYRAFQGDFKTVEDENMYQGDEEELDDDDDFARKVGIIFS